MTQSRDIKGESFYVLTCIVPKIVSGKPSSIAPISLENLFSIRPEEFVWKNRIVVYTILSNILLCKFFEALMQLRMNVFEATSIKKTIIRVKPE